VLLTASDHYVGDAVALMNYVELAFTAVEQWPGSAVLLGITPDEPETAYGWIEPGPALNGVQSGIFQVRQFWEKPTREIARGLMAKGCLWNSFMLVGRLSTLLGLFTLGTPELFVSFSKIRPILGTVFEHETMQRLYEDLRPSDFSRHLLEPAVANLSVLRMNDVGWADLGEPHRVARALA
jgi:mannose-1-phosphate guanylyltransferase